MRKLREILEHALERGWSVRRVSIHFGVSRRSVRRTPDRFRSSGLEWPDVRPPDEGSLEAAPYPPPAAEVGNRRAGRVLLEDPHDPLLGEM